MLGFDDRRDACEALHHCVIPMKPTARELAWLARYWLMGAYASALGRRRSSGAEANSSRAAVVVAPESPGGLGDDAMMSALAGQLVELGFSSLKVVVWRPQDEWKINGTAVSRIDLPRGGLIPWMRFARSIREAAALLVLGADMLDGYYGTRYPATLLGAADIAGRQGLLTTVVGSSFCENARPVAVRLLRQLSPRVQVLARDTYSQGRLEAARRRPVPLVADIAFLLRSATPKASPLVAGIQDWMARQRRAGARLVLGCNLNTLPWIHASKGIEPLVCAYRETLEHLARMSGPISLVLLPHDRRAPHSDVDSLKALSALLPPEIGRNSELLDRPPTAAEVKAIASGCDLILAGRMHLAIASLGAGVPVACVGYQGKSEGLLRHFDLERMVTDWKDVGGPGRLQSWFMPFVARRGEIAAQIASRLPGVLELARRNLQLVQRLPICGPG